MRSIKILAILVARSKSHELETKWAVDTSKWITPPLDIPGAEVGKTRRPLAQIVSERTRLTALTALPLKQGRAHKYSFQNEGEKQNSNSHMMAMRELKLPMLKHSRATSMKNSMTRARCFFFTGCGTDGRHSFSADSTAAIRKVRTVRRLAGGQLPRRRSITNAGFFGAGEVGHSPCRSPWPPGS